MSTTFTRVSDLDHLVTILCELGCRGDFFIQLEGGARSTRHICYDHWRETFHVTDGIDGSRQVFTADELMDPKSTNIGQAIRAGAFYHQAPV